MNTESSPVHGNVPLGSYISVYRLESQIGRGGMATVYKARDERLRRDVALKLLAPALANDGEFRDRFLRETHALITVDDPHIIPVFDAGEFAGLLYIAMSYIRGGDVRSIVKREGPLPPGRAVEIVSQVAAALDTAHRAGLVHRDVKPANMLLVPGRAGRPDHVYLSDFGIAKQWLATSGTTKTGQFLGTFEYAAPEQFAGEPASGQADQYALACSAFELMSGTPPFSRPDAFAVMHAHLHDPPPPLSAHLAGTWAAADRVLQRALAKLPDDRFPSCGQFAAALAAALEGAIRQEPVVVLDRPDREATGRGSAPDTAADPPFAYGPTRTARPDTLVVATAYVANSSDGTISPIDLTARVVAPPINVGGRPRAIAITPDGATAYIADDMRNVVVPVSLATRTAGSPIIVGSRPRAIAISPDGTMIYVANYGDGTVTPIDAATRACAAPIAVGGYPHAIAITPDGSTAYVTRAGECAVTPIDLQTGFPASPISVDGHPQAIAIVPGGTMAYVISSEGSEVGSMTPIVLAAASPEAPIRVGRRPRAIAITPDSATAYVSNYDDDTVTPISLATAVSGAPIGAGRRPTAIAITPDGTTVCVTNELGDTVTTIDIATRIAGTPLKAGKGPVGIVITR